MDALFTWLTFTGSWLLFAGPIYQAALELRDQDLQRDEISKLQLKMPPQKHASPYWWFLPPVKIYLESRQSHKYRREFLKALPTEVVESFVDFMNKAVGWVLVAAGGLLLAIRESHELTNIYHLAWPWLIAIIIVAAFLSMLYTVTVLRRSESLKTHHK